MREKSKLGNRMKEYEKCFSYKLTKNQDYIIRLDGRHFHSLTRSMDKPFDKDFIEVMRELSKLLLKEVQGAKLVYVQSDEISIYITDKITNETEPYFDNKLQKIVSITASFATMHFNKLISVRYPDKAGMFDSRIFMIPEKELANYFIWRQRDWNRNSIQMLARAYYSDKECHKKGRLEMIDMVKDKNVNWENLHPRLRNGTFYYKKDGVVTTFCEKIDYDSFYKEFIENVE